MSKPNVPETDRLFDEIAGKLNELSGNKPTETAAERFERLQSQLKKSQEDWKAAQTNMQERMSNFEQFSNSQNEMGQEIRRMSTLLEQERQNNSKTSGDLAKALELNLKLQFDIEEVRTKAGQLVAEERKHNQFLVEKNRSLSTELELSQAMNQEVRLELGKAREKYLQDQNSWNEEKASFQQQLRQQAEEFEAANLRLDENEQEIQRYTGEVAAKSEEVRRHAEEIRALMEALKSFEEHSHMQNDSMRQLTSTAEKKLVELKLALDKKIIESNDYYSHLQQALTQIQILRQENAALKEYIQKIAQLHQSGQLVSATPSHQQSHAQSNAPTHSPSQSMGAAMNAAVSLATMSPAPTAPAHPAPVAAPVALEPVAAAPVQAAPTPVAPDYGSPMTQQVSTPAFVPNSAPAPVPSGTPAPAWMPAASARPAPPPKPAPPQGMSQGGNSAADGNAGFGSASSAGHARPAPPPKPLPPKSASGL